MDVNSFVLGFMKGKASGGGGGSMDGFHMVRFFNDDQTTLLYTVFVPDRASAIYAGETPVSTEDGGAMFTGFEPAAVNVTEDMDCYAVYDAAVGTLDETPWEIISALSANGTAENYFAVGDTKMIHIEGTVGAAVNVNGDFGVYIIGFDHNEELEGKGIHFGTFKTAVSNGVDVCLVAGDIGQNPNGVKTFNQNHWGGNNIGGWAGCDMRYDILGSTDRAPSGYGASKTLEVVGYDPSDTCATNPVADTLMAALPADLRSVMKPMTKYTNNVGMAGSTEEKVTATTDYLPLLAEFEIFGVKSRAITHEQYKQKRYTYFADGNSALKNYHTNITWAVNWTTRSSYNDSNNGVASVSNGGRADYYVSNRSAGLAPIFKV